MATGLFSFMYGRRPSKAAPALGRPGTNESSLQGYSGLRYNSKTYQIGAGISSSTSIVSAQTLVGLTLPSNLTLATAAAGYTGCPMPLTLSYAIPNGGNPRSLAVSVYGLDQFQQPVREDFAYTNAAINGTRITTGSRIFSKVTAVQVTSVPSDVGTGGAETLSVGVLAAQTPTFGTPILIADASDIQSVTVAQFSAPPVGVLEATAEVRQAGLGLSVSVAQQSFTFGTFAFVDTKYYIVTPIISTSIGTTLGNNRISGQKFFYIR